MMLNDCVRHGYGLGVLALGEVTLEEWYDDYFAPTMVRIYQESLDQPIEVQRAVKNLLETAGRMADAVAKGDDGRLKPLAEMLAKIEYALEYWNSDESWVNTLGDAVSQVIVNFPRDIRNAAVETAGAVGDSLRRLGVDPQRLADEGFSAVKALGFGIGIGAVAYIISKVVK